jgi:hypothetical protein
VTRRDLDDHEGRAHGEDPELIERIERLVKDLHSFEVPAITATAFEAALRRTPGADQRVVAP